MMVCSEASTTLPTRLVHFKWNKSTRMRLRATDNGQEASHPTMNHHHQQQLAANLQVLATR